MVAQFKQRILSETIGLTYQVIDVVSILCQSKDTTFITCQMIGQGYADDGSITSSLVAEGSPV